MPRPDLPPAPFHSLDDLATALNQIVYDYLGQPLAWDHRMPTTNGLPDFTKLPHFAEDRPDRPRGVWSWDAERELLTDEFDTDRFVIVNRLPDDGRY